MAAVASAAAFVAVQMVSRLNTCPQVDRIGPYFLSPPLFFYHSLHNFPHSDYSMCHFTLRAINGAGHLFWNKKGRLEY
jgi:hypothetical protein